MMLRLAGRPVLEHVIERVRFCSLLDEIVIATTTLSRDDVIVGECRRLGVSCFRGSEDDVLSRYYFAATEAAADVVVRVTSDCPLFDPALLALMLKRFALSSMAKLDYLSNALVRTFPRGLDAEIFTYSALRAAHERATKSYEREHVTPFIYQNPQWFTLENFSDDVDLSRYRWTLDTAEDFGLISEIYAALYRPGKLFETADVLALLRSRPELALVNAHVEQKNLTV